jgi:NAD+ kinase
MPNPVVGVCAKANDPRAAEAVRSLSKGLLERDVTVLFDREAAGAVGASGEARSDLAKRVELLVALGGDGTILSLAREMGELSVPVLGVNLGTLGFLAEIAPGDQLEATLRALQGEMPVEARTRLEVRVGQGGQGKPPLVALNEIVIGSSFSRLVDLEARADGRLVTAYRADGLIVSTPTGSTAYSLSAAGPILLPSVQALLLNPICPHTLSQRPVVLPDTMELELRAQPRSSGAVRLTVDGQEAVDLAPGDAVHVRRSDHPLLLVVSPEHDRFEILRSKLGWGAA